MDEERFSFKNIPAQLESTETKSLFSKLYGGKEQTVRAQTARYQELIERYREQFPDASGPIHLFSTPGRTEVGGNHTDHNAGHVLAAAVHFDTIAAAEKTDDNKITVCSEGYPDVFQADLNTLEPIPEEKETTSALIRGIAARFRQLGLRSQLLRFHRSPAGYHSEYPVQPQPDGPCFAGCYWSVCGKCLLWKALRTDGSDGLCHRRIHYH